MPALLSTRRLGRTELYISEMVFGGGFVGGLLVNATDEEKKEAIARFLNAGGNWIDTAASYGQGLSEEAVGWILEGLRPTVGREVVRPYVSTKVAAASPSTEGSATIAEQIETGFRESAARLRLDSFDLYQLHSQISNTPGPNALTPAEILGPGGVAESFEMLKASGLIRHCGITATGDTDAVLEVINSGRFDTAQCYYNMLNPSCAWETGEAPEGWSDKDQDFSGIFAACAAQDMGVLIIRPLAAGVLATDERHERQSAPQYTDVKTQAMFHGFHSMPILRGCLWLIACCFSRAKCVTRPLKTGMLWPLEKPTLPSARSTFRQRGCLLSRGPGRRSAGRWVIHASPVC